MPETVLPFKSRRDLLIQHLQMPGLNAGYAADRLCSSEPCLSPALADRSAWTPVAKSAADQDAASVSIIVSEDAAEACRKYLQDLLSAGADVGLRRVGQRQRTAL